MNYNNNHQRNYTNRFPLNLRKSTTPQKSSRSTAYNFILESGSRTGMATPNLKRDLANSPLGYRYTNPQMAVNPARTVLQQSINPRLRDLDVTYPSKQSNVHMGSMQEDQPWKNHNKTKSFFTSKY